MIEIVSKALSELIPYEKNPRKISDEAVNAVAESIQEFGFKNPILIDKNNVIIAGHTRRLASLKLGLDMVPCVIVDDLTPQQVKALRLADNKTNELAEWDIGELDLELADLLDMDMERFGFEIPELDEPTEVVEDEIPEEVETRCKLGDIWKLGNHRLMCGDSTDKASVERLMDGKKADIGFTSPPYNAGTTATETAMGKKTKYNGADDNKTDTEYRNLLDNYLRCAISVCEYVFMNVQSIANNKIALIDVLSDNRVIYADTIIWDKQNGQPAMARNVLNSVFEYIHVFSEKANRSIGTIDFRGTIDNILHLPPQRNNNYAKIHNATFSVEFASWFISRFAKETVLDSFGGTGTTLIACEQLNRKCYMMELDPHYCDVIVQRWENLTGQKAELIGGASEAE